MSESKPQAELQEKKPAGDTRIQEARFQTGSQQAMTLFAEAPVPYFLLNREGRIQEVNVAGCGLLGRTREALLRKRMTQFLASSSHGSFDVLLTQVFETGLKQRGESQLLLADSVPLEVLLDIDADRNDGEFRHFRLILTDITAHKDAHASLLDMNAAQHQQIQNQAARIREMNQELELVVTTFVRQLYLPATRAMNFLGVTGRKLGGEPDETRQPLLNTERAVQQVIVLLASMERYIQMRSMRVRIRPVDLNSVLKEVRKNARPSMTDRDIQMTSDLLPTIQGDPRALYLVLDEYISNALKFTKGRELARIHILARETESEYHIGVEDNGTGFNMRQKDKLFQLFGRLHSSKVYEGTGVGLVTVQRSCQRFGGRVWAEGKVNQGAIFWFAWPKQPTLRE